MSTEDVEIRRLVTRSGALETPVPHRQLQQVDGANPNQ